MNNVEWAKRELALIGYDSTDEDGPNKWMLEGTLELLGVFAKQGHSGGSAPYAVHLFQRLALWKPLSPLTGEDSEWGTAAGVDQNNRCSAVFRKDDGTFTHSGAVVFWEWFTPENGGEPHKLYFTGRGSSVEITFPYDVPDKPSYRQIGEDGNVVPEPTAVEEAMTTLSGALSDDPDYYHGWHANLSVMMQDAGADKADADDRARSFLKMAFDA